MNIEEIRKVLPQSYPMLMLDKVVELSTEKIVAIKNVSINENFFTGHFKGNNNKVMPGVLIIEAMAQALIVLHNFIVNADSRGLHTDNRGLNQRKSVSNPLPSALNKEYYLGTVKAKFLNPVFPGDILKIIINPIKTTASAGLAKAQAFVGEKKCAEAELGFGVK